MKIIKAVSIASITCMALASIAAQATPSAAIDLSGLTRVTGNNIDFYYDAGVYNSASVSGDELKLGLNLTNSGSIDTTQQIIAVAHTGLTLRANVSTSLQGEFSLTPYTNLAANNSFDAYFANYAGGDLVLGPYQSHPINYTRQTYTWDGVSMSYQGDLSSSIFPTTSGSADANFTSSALLLNSSYFLGLSNNGLPVDGSTASVNSVTYGFHAYFPDTVPSIPEPSSYAMLMAGLGLVGAMRYRRSRV